MGNPHSHYEHLNPEPISVLDRWGIGIEYSLGNIVYMAARILAVHQGAQGYNGRGGSEDCDKIIWWAGQLKEQLQAKGTAHEISKDKNR